MGINERGNYVQREAPAKLQLVPVTSNDLPEHFLVTTSKNKRAERRHRVSDSNVNPRWKLPS